MILLNKLLEDGNTLYRKNRFEEAAHRYGYAVRRIPANISNNNNSVNIGDSIFKDSNANNFDSESVENNNNPTTSGDDLGSPISATFSQLKIHLLLNLSRCQRRLGNRYFLKIKVQCIGLFLIE